MEALKKTLEQMNDFFSSNEFSKKARKNGLSDKDIANGAIAYFLHHNAVQGTTRRMWRKKNVLTPDKSESEKIMEAIKFLKEKGYRVQKQVTEWVNI